MWRTFCGKWRRTAASRKRGRNRQSSLFPYRQNPCGIFNFPPRFADKLTQGVVALCLAVKFPVICPVLAIFILKELTMLCCGGYLLLKKQKRPCAAQWYGKVATVMFYVSVALIVVMDGFLHVEGVAFQVISYVLLGLTAAMMIYSAVKYAQIFLKILRSDDSQYDLSLTDEIRAKTVRDKRIKS